MVLHSLYNHVLVQPILATALIVLVFPWLSIVVFQASERETSAWLGVGFDTDQELLHGHARGADLGDAGGQLPQDAAQPLRRPR